MGVLRDVLCMTVLLRGSDPRLRVADHVATVVCYVVCSRGGGGGGGSSAGGGGVVCGLLTGGVGIRLSCRKGMREDGGTLDEEAVD